MKALVSSRRTLADLSVFGKGYMRSRVGAFFSLIFPVILILLFGAIFSGGSSGPVTVYIQNQDGGAASAQLVSALNGTAFAHNSAWPITLVSVPVDKNFSAYLLAHSSSDGIVIPAGFTDSMAAGRMVNLTVYGNPASTASAIVSGVVRGVADSFNLALAHGTPVVGVASVTAASPSYKYIDFLVPGLIGFSVLTSPMFALVNISSEYKRDKVFKLLSLTPLTKTEWLLSKIVWYILLTALSFVLMSVTGIAIFGAHISFTWGVLPFLLLGPFLFVSLGMLVGTVSNSPESAAVVGNLITFPMMFLSGTFFPVSSMPMYLQSVAHVLPLFYVIDGLNDVMIYGNYGPAYLDLAILAVISVAIFALAVKLFKWRED